MKWGPKHNPDPIGDPLFWLLIFLVFCACWAVVLTEIGAHR